MTIELDQWVVVTDKEHEKYGWRGQVSRKHFTPEKSSYDVLFGHGKTRDIFDESQIAPADSMHTDSRVPADD